MLFDTVPLTELGVAMVVAMVGKVDLGQGVTGELSRTGGNRTGRPNVTERDRT